MNKIRWILVCLLIAGCGRQATEKQDSPTTPQVSEKRTVRASETINPQSEKVDSTQDGYAERKMELVNPDDRAIVFLYYSLTKVPAPLDTWIEDDNRVLMAQGSEKAATRQQVHAELEAGLASVHDVGRLRLSLNDARLSDFDPTYGEFTIGALSPSSRLSWHALNHEIQLNFSNATTAQSWKVSPQEAQGVRDKLGRYGRATLDVLVQITGVVPGEHGGKITAKVVEYELRDAKTSTLLGRLRPA